MRYAPEPDDLYLTVSALDGGIAAAAAPPVSNGGGQAIVRDKVRQDILNALPAKSKTEVAAVLGRRPDDSTLHLAWAELEPPGGDRQGGPGLGFWWYLRP